MKFKRLDSNKEVGVSINKYLIDWNRKVSGPQKKVKEFLYPYWKTNCVMEEFRMPGGLMRFDLVNLTKWIIVEVSPMQHFEYNPYFHKTIIGYKKSLKRDMDKIRWAEQNEFEFVEIEEADMDVLSPKWFLDNYNITL